MVKYTNRHGDEFTFTKQENGNILWEGPFTYMRMGGDTEDPTFIDPSGGPYLEKGKMLSHIVWDEDFNVIIEGFKNIKGGFIIQTKPHIYDPNDMSHLADTKIIGGIINTSE